MQSLLHHLLVCFILMIDLLPVLRVYNDIDVQLFLLPWFLWTLSIDRVEHTLNLCLDRLSIEVLFLDGGSTEWSGSRLVLIVGCVELPERIVASNSYLHTSITII